MPGEVIAHVHRIALWQKAHPGLVFEDCNQMQFDDDHHDDRVDDDDDLDYTDDDDDEFTDDEDKNDD